MATLDLTSSVLDIIQDQHAGAPIPLLVTDDIDDDRTWLAQIRRTPGGNILGTLTATLEDPDDYDLPEDVVTEGKVVLVFTPDEDATNLDAGTYLWDSQYTPSGGDRPSPWLKGAYTIEPDVAR